ncbi:MAG: apolipoprotein N-acyltransferase [Gammaproteobacteria bacterium]|nr:apolipoprotein N-acyltransferase [Gammaproteobacteria bacterium]
MLSGRWADLLALLLGALLTLAFAPFEVRLLAVLIPALMLWLWLPLKPKQAAWRGWLFGVGLFGTGVSWVYHSLHLFGDAVAPLAAFLTLLFAMFLALFFALLGYLFARFPLPSEAKVARLLLLGPALWVLMELFRGWFLTGFPWLLLGYAHLDTPLAGYAPLLGVLMLSWLSLLSGGLLLLLLGSFWQRKNRRAASLLLMLSLIWGGGLLLEQFEWSEPVGEPIQVALLQGNVPQDKKYRRQRMRSSIERYMALSRQQSEADLIVWPETAVPTSFRNAEALLQPLATELAANKQDLLLGTFLTDAAEKRYYNAVLNLLHPEEHYYKQHLVPFGEYMPLRFLLDFLSRFIVIPMSDLASGSAMQAPLAVAGHFAGVAICYESAYGAVVAGALPQADFLVNVSNDAWFGDSLAPEQHLEIVRMRALELSRPLVRATNTGISAFVDHKGNVLQRGPKFVEWVMTAEVAPRQGRTGYMIWGSKPLLAVLLLLLSVLWWRGKKARLAKSV